MPKRRECYQPFSIVDLAWIEPSAGERRNARFVSKNFRSLYLQSRCFFLGPIISSVVALQTDLARPCPAMLCLAANSLSLIVCPAILSVTLGSSEKLAAVAAVHVYDDVSRIFSLDCLIRRDQVLALLTGGMHDEKNARGMRDVHACEWVKSAFFHATRTDGRTNERTGARRYSGGSAHRVNFTAHD